MNQQELLDKARAGLANAYCPYSKFPVSAVLLCEDGTIVHGVNVENASYGGTICAERSALCAAVSAGHRKFKSITVVTNLETPASPCGLCRQFMVEFGDYEVVMGGANGTVEVMSTYKLLPLAFTPASLDEFNSQPSK
ncbi:hypothetical protein PENTCL1PPCAC_18891 [Pristionchus entomophagus]|uniref:Cytidine deaminase n=1 Tax=Pristionchus entomophagus TaxID=358040 RepID=A0AAV5TQX4_9BILA|nr:hypothetical protein PENTCL1PPCAC_18891 [Pristionchus entomophagus]